jgi:hypothetical protein
MADDTQKRSKHDARLEFSKLLADIMRNVINATQLNSLQPWWGQLYNYYAVTSTFINNKEREDFKTRLDKLDNTISISETNAPSREIKFNIARKQLYTLMTEMFAATAHLLTPIDTDDDDDNDDLIDIFSTKK